MHSSLLLLLDPAFIHLLRRVSDNVEDYTMLLVCVSVREQNKMKKVKD